MPLGQLAQNSPELSLLKFLPLTCHHSHFLAATLDFTSFFTIAFLRAAHFFLQFGCFGLDFTSFCISSVDFFNLYIFFSLPQEEEKMKQIYTLNISDFISKCINYIYNSYIYLLQNSPWWFLCN